MDLSEFAQPYIKLADVKNVPLRKVIAGAEKSKNFDQLVANFTDHTNLSLCKTNLSAIMKATGITRSEALAGLEIELYAGPLPDGSGGTKEGVCVRVPTGSAKAESTDQKLSPPKLAAVKPPAVKAAPKKPPEGDGLDDPLPTYLQRS